MKRSDPAEEKKHLIECAAGKRPADLIIAGVTVLHLTDGTLEECDIAIIDGKIAGLGKYTCGKSVIDGRGLFAVPGFIDSHVHLESSHLLPNEYERLVVPHGVTTSICDPHELANVVGEKAFAYFFSAAEKLTMSLIVHLSSCVPATPFETAGAQIDAAAISKWKALHPESRLAELMNVPGLLACEEDLLVKAALFDCIDGHCPMLSNEELNGVAAAGVVNCHESTLLEEAAGKLRRGLQVFIREGSAAKNLDNLIPLITIENSPFLSFCTDDRSPLEIENEGHIDSMIRRAIEKGADPLAVYRVASWSAANHAGLRDRGLIAPGKRADIVLLNDLKTCQIRDVIVKGIPSAMLPAAETSAPAEFTNSVKCKMALPEDFIFHSEKKETLIIDTVPGSLITEKLVRDLPLADGKKMCDPSSDILKIAVMERHGRNGNIGLGFVHGFGLKNGALATTVAHDSHNICVVGSSEKDMAEAVNALILQQGGFTVVQNGKVTAGLHFPVAGLFTDRSCKELNKELKKIMEAVSQTGCTLPEPFQQLSFLALPVIPHLKLTDRGLFDADIFQHIFIN